MRSWLCSTKFPSAGPDPARSSSRTGLGRAIVAQRWWASSLELVAWSSRARSGRVPAGGHPASSPFAPGHRSARPISGRRASSVVGSRTSTGRILGHHDEPAGRRGRPASARSAGWTSGVELGSGERTVEPGDVVGRRDRGATGPADRRRPLAPIMPGWDGYPIRDRFAERYARLGRPGTSVTSRSSTTRRRRRGRAADRRSRARPAAA